MVTSSRRIVAALTGLAVAGLGVVTAASPAQAVRTSPAAASASNRAYVALGDSYAAGFGLPTPAVATAKPVPGCAQTTLDYPHQVAKALNLQLTDVTCSGAVTNDFTGPQVTPAGTAPPQIDAVRKIQPGLVTITIGGNDLAFGRTYQDCLSLTADGPLLLHPTYASCAAYYASTAAGGGAADNPYDLLSKVAAKVARAIGQVQAAAPHARVVVIAYPAILPNRANTPAGGCFDSEPTGGTVIKSALPISDIDVPFLQHLQQRLDRRVGEAATAAGAGYADIYPSSLAHSACTPESNRWVEPLFPGGGGTNLLHPSIAGTGAMAKAVIRKIIYP